MPRISDLFPPTAASIARGPGPTASSIIKGQIHSGSRRVSKSEDEVSIDGGAAGHDLPDGSMERIISIVSGPCIQATPCPASAEGYYGSAYFDGNYHWPNVQGTYPDHVIVGCESCDAFWKVPYEIKSEDGRADVVTGEPEARVRTFMAPAAVIDAINDPPFEPQDEPAKTDPKPSSEGDENA